MNLAVWSVLCSPSVGHRGTVVLFEMMTVSEKIFQTDNSTHSLIKHCIFLHAEAFIPEICCDMFEFGLTVSSSEINYKGERGNLCHFLLKLPPMRRNERKYA